MNTLCFPSRRKILATGAAAASGLVLIGKHGLAQGLKPTPSCHDGDEPTLPEIEGPFFKPRSPKRSDLREGVSGRPVELSGLVLSRSCRPIAGVLVDLWQADDSGDYDNKGFRLRGHIFTDADGRYAFRTIVPGLYPGRTRHYHVKVQAPRKPVLTTQFYFPDEPYNAKDEYFHPELVMQVTTTGDYLQARFDVVMAMR
jgi:protocatechuate 3,4-dioxygenase beta subunit